VFAERFMRRQAEHPFGGWIEQDDPLFVIDGDDPVHRRGDDAFKALHGFDSGFLAKRLEGFHEVYLRCNDRITRRQHKPFYLGLRQSCFQSTWRKVA
jgi:hypothetical protein